MRKERSAIVSLINDLEYVFSEEKHETERYLMFVESTNNERLKVKARAVNYRLAVECFSETDMFEILRSFPINTN